MTTFATKWFIHARTDAECAELQKLGWQPRDPAPLKHHGFYSVPHIWEGEVYPPLPDSIKARAP